ncbi:MAG: hypothetical protein ACLTT1_09770 [[Clostridium] scindens]
MSNGSSADSNIQRAQLRIKAEKEEVARAAACAGAIIYAASRLDERSEWALVKYRSFRHNPYSGSGSCIGATRDMLHWGIAGGTGSSGA